MRIGEAIYDHVTSYFREPVVVTTFSLPDLNHSIQILGFDRVYAGCRVHVSFGFSNYANVVGHTAEVFVPAEGFEAELPEVIAASLFRLVTNNRYVERGVAIPFGDVLEEFAAAANKYALYVTDPFDLPAEFRVVRVPTEKKAAHIFLGLLVTASEQRLIETEGFEKFEEFLESSGVDPYVITRQAIA